MPTIVTEETPIVFIHRERHKASQDTGNIVTAGILGFPFKRALQPTELKTPLDNGP